MSVLEWKMFNFFKLVPLKINYKFENIKNTITSHCSNTQYKIFCTANGAVYIFKDWECLLTLQVTENPIHFCTLVEETDILIILEQNKLKNEIDLKIYNVGKLSKRKPAQATCTATLESRSKVMTVKGFNMENQVCVAIGLENGNILFSKSTITRDITNSFKPISVCLKAIKGIEFLSNDMGVIKMFACSDAGVFCYTVAYDSSNMAETKLILDDTKDPIHCWTLKTSQATANKEQYFVVGRIDALYCYTLEGRGPCYAIDGQKQIVKWYGSHLLVVLRNVKPWGHSSQLVVININNKMIVLNQELNNSVLCIIPTADYSNCFIFLTDGRIFTLQERELQYKLKLLYSKNLYDIAIKLLEDSNAEAELMVNALVRYGDYLLQRGDILQGVEMYIKTIGLVSPFHIINKLMNSRHNEYLILYLQRLVESDYKSEEHVELLRNCCRRVEMPEKVAQIFEEDKLEYNSKSLQVDSCLVLEDKSKISKFLNIIDDYQEFSLYFSKMSPQEIYEFFEEFGYWLMKHYPKEITNIAKYLTSNRQELIYKLNCYFLPFLLVNKQCAFEVLTNLPIPADSLKTNSDIYIIWVDLVLKMWQKGYVDLNFVIEYIKSHSSELSVDNAFIICRTYQFWPGIIMMYERCSRDMLSISSLVKFFEMSPRDMLDYLPNAHDGSSHQIWMQTLSKANLDANISQKFVNVVLGRMINRNPYYILNVLQSIVGNNNLQLCHLNEIFAQDNFLIMFKNNDLDSEVSNLEEKVLKYTQLLNKFKQCPIEFRSRLCDICKQNIKQPTVYFLCQHSFHRECINSNSDVPLSCVTCKNNAKSQIGKNSDQHPLNTTNKTSTITSPLTSLKLISSKLSVANNFTLKHYHLPPKVAENVEPYKVLPRQYDNITTTTTIKPTKDKIAISTNPFENEDDVSCDTTNPFNEYDANLNPFEENTN